MKNTNQELENRNSTSNTMPVLAGLLVGSLAGAGAMLLLAPQSGKETRAQIQQKTLELRDRTTETVEQTLAQAKSKTHQITADIRGKAEEFQHQGQQILVKQLDHVSEAVEAGKTAVKGS